MDYGLLCEKRDRLRQVMADIPSDVLGKFDKSFEIEYTHNSTAIEGNTLTLIQTKAILEDGLSVGGKLLREIYEVANHARAFQYVKKCIAEDKPLNEQIVKEIHARLMENIQTGGVYRNVEVRITGASHRPRLPVKCTGRSKSFSLLCPRSRTRMPLNRPPGHTLNSCEFIRSQMGTDGLPA